MVVVWLLLSMLLMLVLASVLIGGKNNDETLACQVRVWKGWMRLVIRESRRV